MKKNSRQIVLKVHNFARCEIAIFTKHPVELFAAKRVCVRVGAQRRIRGRMGPFTMYRRYFYTPFVDSDRCIPHAVRVSLPKLYCRKADFTRVLRPRSPSASSTSVGIGCGGITTSEVVTSSARDVLRRISRTRHLPFFFSFSHLFTHVMRCSRYTIRIVNACIFLN